MRRIAQEEAQSEIAEEFGGLPEFQEPPVERTRIGQGIEAQQVLPGTQTPELPKTPLKPTKKQAEGPTELERGPNEEQGTLFGLGEPKGTAALAASEWQSDLPKTPEITATVNKTQIIQHFES